MKQIYDLCILGATAAALGFAETHPGLDIIILEEGMTPVREFSASLKHSPAPSIKNAFLDELIERKAVGETIWQPAVAPVAAGRFKSLENADTYFFTAITSLDSTDDGYKVAFAAYGLTHTFKAKKLLDTSSKQFSAPYTGLADKSVMRFNYLTTIKEEGEFPEYRSIECPDGIARARMTALENAANESRKILFAATEPEYTFTTPGEGILLHSAYFPDPATAYESGAKLRYEAIPTPTAKTPAPVDDGEYDIIIAGLGTAGAIAATVASDNGMKVLGVDMLDMQGGSGTAGGVLGYYYGFKGGVYRDIDKESVAIEAAAPGNSLGFLNKPVILDKRTEKIDRRYATITGAIHDGKKIAGIRFSENGRPHEARAKFVIDCTAESIVCVAAGLDMQGGRDFDGGLQTYSSVCFGTDFKKAWYSYIDNGRISPYDPDEFSAAILDSASSYIHLKNDYSNRRYLGIAPLIGLREGLRPVGEDTVRFPDLVEGRFTKEPVCYGYSNLDNHGKDPVFEDRAYQDFITVSGLWGYGVAIPLPVGALIPKGSDGILVAGRSVAVSHDIAMGMRMKDDCQKSGEAAARLAVLAINNGVRAQDADLQTLCEELKATGCLGETDRMILEKQKAERIYEYPFWCSDREEISKGLASDEPGYYIWSARELGDTEFLAGLIGSDDTNLSRNAALALAITDAEISAEASAELKDKLLECAKSTDGYVPQTGRKYMNLRSVSAISAITRLAEKNRLPAPEKAADELVKLLEGAKEIADTLPFEPYDLITDREDLRFQYESHLAAAIAAIGKAAPALNKKTREALESFFAKAAEEGRKLEVSLMSTKGFKLDCTESLRKLTLG